jgi:hypothetical protein
MSNKNDWTLRDAGGDAVLQSEEELAPAFRSGGD